MPYLSPSTLTHAEQKALLQVTSGHARDHTISSLALGTGLRLGEIVGLNVGDLYFPDGIPRTRVRLRPEIAKGGRAGDVFLPDALVETPCDSSSSKYYTTATRQPAQQMTVIPTSL